MAFWCVVKGLNPLAVLQSKNQHSHSSETSLESNCGYQSDTDNAILLLLKLLAVETDDVAVAKEGVVADTLTHQKDCHLHDRPGFCFSLPEEVLLSKAINHAHRQQRWENPGLVSLSAII